MGYRTCIFIVICVIHAFSNAASISQKKSDSDNNNKEIVAVSTARQSLGGFSTITQYFQNIATNALSAMSLLFMNMFQYSVTNFGVPENLYSIIPIRRWLGWGMRRNDSETLPEMLPTPSNATDPTPSHHESRRLTERDVYLITELAAFVLSAVV